MNLAHFLLLAYFTISLEFCLSEDLPPFIHVCHKDEPKMLECIIAVGEELRPYLVKGVPEYDIPSLEPIVLHDLISEESAGLRLTATDIVAWGGANYFIKSLKMDMDKQTYELELSFPEFKIEARYNVTGKIMVMPVKGDGPMNANITNCVAKTFIQGELYEKNGDTYLKFTSMSIKIDVGDGQVKVENLFNGDKLLNDIVNETINKNLDVFLSELMPFIERALSSAFLDIANKVVDRFTYKQLFPH